MKTRSGHKHIFSYYIENELFYASPYNTRSCWIFLHFHMLFRSSIIFVFLPVCVRENIYIKCVVFFSNKENSYRKEKSIFSRYTCKWHFVYTTIILIVLMQSNAFWKFVHQSQNYTAPECTIYQWIVIRMRPEIIPKSVRISTKI
jgi:hypothetical protein